MIAIDTCSLIAYLEGQDGPDTELVDRALSVKSAVLPPVVVAEIFSTPHLHSAAERLIQNIELLSVTDGHWRRAGELRARVLTQGRKARLPDALIAQACLDAGVSLITRDKDFHAFALAAGLDLSP